MAYIGDTAIKRLDARGHFLISPSSTPFAPTVFPSRSNWSPLAALPPRTPDLHPSKLPTTSTVTTTPRSSVSSLPRANSPFSTLSFKSSHSSMTTVVTTRTDMLEQLFQRLEEEHEIRALAQEEPSLVDVPPASAHQAHEDPDALLDPTVDASIAATVRAPRDRRRGSISISRYGGPTAEPTITEPRITSTRPSRSSSIVLQKPAFYQLDTTPSGPARTGSADSLASDNADPAMDVEEPDLVTQIAQIHPARSISRAISRRLSRAKELPLPSPSSTSTLVIGVAVEEATHESNSIDDGPRVTVTTSTLRTQRSTPGLRDKAAAAAGSPAGWVSKAKDMFRRRSIAALSSPVPAR
ncbi:hypothetical protein BC629DRAFT_1458891 [Irpex lacteus]|nr:hypothetical protein BC629DRAFT_1458891 [Irpex lacteus]